MRISEIETQDALQWLTEAPDNSVNLIFSSPPYPEKGERYGDTPGARTWRSGDWVVWMASLTEQAVRVSSGYVFWVVNGAVKDREYHPAPEMLMLECYSRGIVVERPVIWHKNALPNRKDYFNNVWEYVLAFRRSDATPTFNWETVATPYKYENGGNFRQRDTKGVRKSGKSYPTGKLARPKDVQYVTVGGGHMGFDSADSKLASSSVAPFPVKLASYFIQVCCPTDGIVADPFMGSGTTAVAAELLQRKWCGCDLDPASALLALNRVVRVNTV